MKILNIPQTGKLGLDVSQADQFGPISRSRPPPFLIGKRPLGSGIQ